MGRHHKQELPAAAALQTWRAVGVEVGRRFVDPRALRHLLQGSGLVRPQR